MTRHLGQRVLHPPAHDLVDLGVHAFQGTRYTVAGEVPKAIGNHHAAIAPYGLFRTADSPVQVAVGSESLWPKFARVAGLDNSGVLAQEQIEDRRFQGEPSMPSAMRGKRHICLDLSRPATPLIATTPPGTAEVS